MVLSTRSLGSMTYVLYDVLEKLIPAGIPQYLMKYHSDIFELQAAYNEGIGIFKILSLSDYMVVFTSWICGCVLAAITLLFEERGYLARKTLKKICKIGKHLICNK
jgi:hypothetical protein